jgi:hypothetical protein
MRTYLFILSSLILFSSCQSEKSRTGLKDDFAKGGGWYEVMPPHDTVSPIVKMEFRSGAMIIHHMHRTLEEAYKWCPWIRWKRDFSSNLRKKYGVVDLDKYHYVVLNVQQKGSSSYFDINGFTTKLGYTTGITVIDLKDYDHPGIKGKQMVDFGIDLQDNNTYLVLDELKFVSKLNKEEKQKLIGAGLTIRDENLKPRPYHGLEALKVRQNTPIPVLDGEEMAIFRDDATGGITTRLTAAPGDDNFGEGGIWSADGEAIKFESPRKINGIPICLPGEGKVIPGPAKAVWNIWSPVDPDILYNMKKEGIKFTVSSWNKKSGEEKEIANFTLSEPIAYVEFKNFTDLGNLVVGFRETPNLYIVNVKNKSVKYIHLPVRLKDASVGENENLVTYANCYTFELRSFNIKTKEQGLVPSFSAGHASWGPNGMVANFGGHLSVFVPDTIGITWTPGNQITIWANWKNDIVTDYGSLTNDNKYVFTNGRNADVDSQHLMIPSADPGAVMRVARYFTKFSWKSTTYSRPSPDYTKLIYNENAFGSTELQMVYTRRPNAPVNVKLEGSNLTWNTSEPNKEIFGYNIYASNQSGRDFVKINDKPLEKSAFAVDNAWKYYAVASVENSGLESSLSREVSAGGARSFYFEAEEMTLVAPARRFFDGYCNNFQCVRINSESEKEKDLKGIVRLEMKEIPSGKYSIWGRVRGKGTWLTGHTKSAVSAGDWQWIKLGRFKSGGSDKFIEISSGDDALKLDLILVTAEDFVPKAPYPNDGIAPGQVQGLSAVAKGKQVTLSWVAPADRDIHHYSVYCGKTTDFKCDNVTIIRSVLKTSVTDAVPFSPEGLYYKVIAVDNRWNESVPAVVVVK